MELLLSNPIFTTCVILSIIGFILSLCKNEFKYVLVSCFFISFAAAIYKTEEYEKTLESYGYETTTLYGEIIPAKTCELKNEQKVCEVLEYTLKGEGSRTKTIEVVVENYWEK